MFKDLTEILYSEKYTGMKGRMLRVMIVDENEFSQIKLSLLLNQLGNCTTVTGDSHEALSILKSGSLFDVILISCDKGEELTRRIRETEGQICSNRLLIIGYGDNIHFQECIQSGMDDVLPIPLNKMRLKAVLGYSVRKRYASIG